MKSLKKNGQNPFLAPIGESNENGRNRLWNSRRRKTGKHMGCMLAFMIIFACTTIAPFSAFAAGEKVAIILQENTGRLDVLDVLDPTTRKAAETFIDGLAENFESLKTTLQFGEKYDKIHNLTDTLCTRANLLAKLKSETQAGNTIDLFIYGHGNSELLQLHSGTLTGKKVRKDGTVIDPGNIGTMLTEAGLPKFNLRLVYMCNCFGSSVNNDWIAIGADTSIGSVGLNIPEPQIGNFIGNFVVNNMPAKAAVDKAYNDSLLLWTFVPADIKASSKPTVAGNTNLRHTNTRVSVGETRQYAVAANKTHNFPHLFTRKNEKYTLTAPSSDEWKNGSTASGPAGYTPTVFDALRRHAEFNQMALVGEVFKNDNDPLPTSYTGKFFKVGTSGSYNPAVDGYFCFFANDILTGYGDNSGSITGSIKRTQ